MSKVSKAMSTLKFAQNDKKVPLSTKIKLQIIVLMDVVLQGSKTHNCNKAHIPIYKLFYYKSICRIMDISILKIKWDEIKMRKLEEDLIMIRVLRILQKNYLSEG